MTDAHTNFAYSTITGTASVGDNNDAGTTGTTISIGSGNGALFPAVPFNATIWPASMQPTSANAEIVRVTLRSTDTFTVSRQQEGSSIRNILHTDQIAATITAKTLVDAENPLTSFSPYVYLGSNAASGLQTLGSTYNLTGGTNSLYIFPVTVPGNIAFNQIAILNSIGYSLSNTSNATEAIYNTHYSYFGIYSMNASTELDVISRSSFSIAETYSNSSYITWSFPTTTATTGYGYGSLGMSGTAEISRYIQGSRVVGLQFGGNMNLENGIYYIGLLSLRSSAAGQRTAFGLSHAGVIGQIINPVNQAATAASNSVGLLQIGSAATVMTANRGNSTQWWGKHIAAFLTSTGRAAFGGTTIPTTLALSDLAGAGGNATTQTILPAVYFVST